ncbi:MAG: tetratricopeptide repeat protein [Desulfuromonadaceae bacterium]
MKTFNLATVFTRIFVLSTFGLFVNDIQAQPSPEEFKKLIQQYNATGQLPAVPQRQQPKAVEQFNRALSLHTKKNASSGELKEAAALYQSASDAGISAAKINLALLYTEGKGVKKNVKKAIELLNQAAKSNEPQADVMLARIYLYSTDATRDEKKGELILNKAAKAGNQNAVKTLAEYKDWKRKNEETMKQFQEMMKKNMVIKPATPPKTATVPAFNYNAQLADIPVIPGYHYLKKQEPFAHFQLPPQTSQTIKLSPDVQTLSLDSTKYQPEAPTVPESNLKPAQ